MKISNWILCLGIASPLDASVRNPFIIPLSQCETTLKQLDDWRLQGAIISSSRSFALMTDSQQQSARVALGSELVAGVTIAAIARYVVKASLNKICDGAYYHWHLPGGENDKEGHRHTIIHSAIRHQSGSACHADRG